MLENCPIEDIVAVAADEVLLMEATLPVDAMLLNVILAAEVLLVEVTTEVVLLVEVVAGVVEVFTVLVASLNVGKPFTTFEETIKLPAEGLELKLMTIFW